MKNIIILLIVLPLTSITQVTFDNRYNVDYPISEGTGLIESDSYYISYGSKGDFSQIDTVRPMFLVVDKQGNAINNQKINNNTCSFRIHNYITNNEGNYIGVGGGNTAGDTCGFSLQPFFQTRNRMYLHKIDENGNIVWQKNYGDTVYDNQYITAFDIAKANDNDYFIYGQNSLKLFILKINEQGDSLNSKIFNFGEFTTTVHKIEKIQDGYLCFFDEKVMKVNEQLDSLWTKQLYINTNNIKPTFDNGFILCTNSYTYPVHSTILKKIDKDANVEWTQTYKAENIINVQEDNFYTGNCVAETKDGNFVSAFKDIIKIDINGNLLWRKRLIKDNIFFYYNDIIETQDGGFLLTGRTGITFQTILTKLDCNGNIEWSTNSCLLPTEEDILVFPNPMLNELTFQLPNISKENNIKITIYNSIGQKLSETLTKNQQIITINTNKFNSGIYLYSIYLDGERYKTGKLIK